LVVRFKSKPSKFLLFMVKTKQMSFA
jgi:hypothetical protein